jgi:hypothetical protein
MKGAFSAIIVLVLLFSACTPGEKGTLQGTISIGPLCPVEHNPPLPECLPTRATYNVWPISVWTEGKAAKVAPIIPNLDGTYSIQLSPGNYVVDLDKPNTFGSRNLPANVKINSAKETVLDISIDTGIR